MNNNQYSDSRDSHLSGAVAAFLCAVAGAVISLVLSISQALLYGDHIHFGGEVVLPGLFGSIIGALGYVLHKRESRFRKRLIEREQRMQTYLDVAGVMMLVLDIKGQITLINQRGCEILGTTESETIGKDWFENFLPERHRKPVKEVFNHLIRGEIEPVEYYENEILTSNGEMRIIAWHNTVLRDEAGSINYVLGSGDDITERKLTEQKLQEAKSRLDLTLKASNIGIWCWDTSSNKVIFSPEWKKQIGYADDELSNRYEEWESRLHPEDREEVTTALMNYLHGEIPEYSVEFRLQHKDGSYRWIFTRAELLFDENGKPIQIQGCHVDITERKRMQEQLLQSEKLASIGTLVAGIAHEINNPTMFITLNTDCVKQLWDDALPLLKKFCKENGLLVIGMDPVDSIEEMADTAFQHIFNGADRIKNIVHELKAYSRNESIDNAVRTSINKVVRSAVTLTQSRIKHASDNFHTHYAQKLPRLMLQSQRLEQVVINLITNACEAMSDKSKAISVTTAYDNEKNAIVLEVKDEGAGMTQVTMKQIFDPFFTTKRESGGTGLGLSISSRIINDIGGTLSYESAPDEGTTATITLPVQEKGRS